MIDSNIAVGRVYIICCRLAGRLAIVAGDGRVGFDVLIESGRRIGG